MENSFQALEEVKIRPALEGVRSLSVSDGVEIPEAFKVCTFLPAVSACISPLSLEPVYQMFSVMSPLSPSARLHTAPFWDDVVVTSSTGISSLWRP